MQKILVYNSEDNFIIGSDDVFFPKQLLGNNDSDRGENIKFISLYPSTSNRILEAH